MAGSQILLLAIVPTVTVTPTHDLTTLVVERKDSP